jgi:hypothetical protein
MLPASPDLHTTEVRVYLARIRPQYLLVPATKHLFRKPGGYHQTGIFAHL